MSSASRAPYERTAPVSSPAAHELVRYKPSRPRPRLLSAELAQSRVFPFIHFVCDGLALILAWVATVEVRTLANPVFSSRIPHAAAFHLAPPLSWMVGLWVLVSLWRHLYRPRDGFSLTPAMLRLAESNVLMCGMAIVAVFLSRQMGFDVARSFVFLFAPISFVCLICSLYASLYLVPCVERVRGPVRAAVLGAGTPAGEVIESILTCAWTPLQLQGLIVPEKTVADPLAAPLPVIGTTRQLAEVINRARLDEIIVVADSVPPLEVERCSAIAKRMGVTVSRFIQRKQPDAILDHRVRHGFHCVELRAIPFTRRQELVKRTLDVILASFLLLLLSPLFLLIAVLVRASSPGPVFYKAPRVGRGGRYFTFWKFRSMYTNVGRAHVHHNNEKHGHIFKIRHDPRITPIGRILRRTSLDELPQLFNVLMGNMSLVGPRPLPASDLDPDGMSREFYAWAEGRARVRPGITGLWQIRGRSDLEFEQMIDFDLEYIGNWSVFLDLRILFETPLVVLTGRGAC